MATVSQVAIKILVDGRELDAVIKDFDGDLKRSGVSGQKSGRSIKEGFTVAKIAIVAAAAAITGIIMGLNKCVDAASNFTEANNKMLVIFKSIPDAARAVRDELVNAYFLSYREAAQLLGATGDLLTGLGMQEQAALDLSEATIKIAAEITSFSNAQGGAEAVAHALTAAYTGEREALKTYSIIINEAMMNEELRAAGLDKLTGLALMQAKAELTLTMALTQSKNAMGDTARTANDYASVQRQVAAQMENLSMNLGSVFIPVWNQVLKGFLDLLKIIGEENITGILYASWIVIREFSVRTYNLISGIVGALASLMSKNYVAATVYMMQIETALRDGWDDVFKEIEEAQEQGIIDYKSFLDGSLNAWRESNAIQDEEQAVIDEERLAKQKVYWDAVTARVKKYDGDLNKVLMDEEKRRAKLAMNELKIEDTKNKAKEKSYQTTMSAIGGMLSSFFGRSKEMMKAQAAIDTYAGMNRALGTGIPPFSFITAAIVFAKGMANVIAINAQKFALGGEINKPTLALAGEKGREIFAPRKTFVDVVNQMTRSGEIGDGDSKLLKEIKGMREAFEDQELVVTLEDDQLAIRVERGDAILGERDY